MPILQQITGSLYSLLTHNYTRVRNTAKQSSDLHSSSVSSIMYVCTHAANPNFAFTIQ